MHMDLWLIFDVAVVAIFAFCVIFAYKRGFMKSSYTIISLIATIALVFVFRAPFEEFIEQSALGQNIRKNITLQVGKTAEEQAEGADTAEVSESMGFPKFLQDSIQKQAGAAADSAADFVNSVSQSVTTSIIQLIAVVLLFVIIRIAVFIVLKVLDALFKLPVLNFVNKTAGILVGILNALLLIYIISAAILLFAPVDKLTQVQDAMEHTYIAHYFYDNNILMKLFM